ENYQKAYDILSELHSLNPPESQKRRIEYFLGRALYELDKFPIKALQHLYRVYGKPQLDNLTDDAIYYTADVLRDDLDQPSLSASYLKTIRKHFKNSDYFSDAGNLLNQLDVQAQEAESFDTADIPPPKVRLNFQDISLSDFISTYAELTGTNFLISTQVSGSVTLIGKEGIPLDKLFDVFLNVLETRGYTVVKKDNVYEVKQLQQALQSGIGFSEDRSGLTTELFALDDLPWDEVINAINVILPRTKNLIRLRKLNRIMITARPDKLSEVENLISTFRVMTSKKDDPTIFSYTPEHTELSGLSSQLESLLNRYINKDQYNLLTDKKSGSLLIVVPSSQKSRVKDLISILDKDADKSLVKELQIKTFNLEYAAPDKVKQKLTELLKVLPGDFISSNIKIVVDNRQKALIVSTKSQTALTLIEKTINDIDQKSKSVPDNVRVFQLEYADVADVKQSLSDMKNVLPGQYPGGEIKFIANQRRRSIIVAAESEKVFPIIEDVIRQIDKKDVQQPMQHHVYNVKNSEAGPLAEKLNALFKGQKQDGKGRQLRVTADEQSNSLVISASPQQWTRVKKMLNRLDDPKKQVLVDVYIAEASKDLVDEVGVEWNLEARVSDRDITAGPEFGLRGRRGTRFDASGSPQNSGSISGNLFGLNAGLLDPGGGSLQALIHALDRNENFKLLSSSHLVSNENEQASLSVGEIIPLKTKEQQSTSTSSNVVNSFKFEDVGIELKLTPTLGSDSTVTMDLEQQIEEVIGSSGQGLPTRRTRDVKTKVAVPNNETLVLGGVIQSQQDNTDQTVPIIGQIPVLRWFFSFSNNTTQQRNLLVFLQPNIISTTDDIDRETQRLNQQRNEQTNIEQRIDQLESMISPDTSSR
ncbi:MAG: secretin N-terminal domain-containing protein, partial [bacterium]